MKIKFYRYKVTRPDGSAYYTRFRNLPELAKTAWRIPDEHTIESESIDAEIAMTPDIIKKFLAELGDMLDDYQECREYCDQYR